MSGWGRNVICEIRAGHRSEPLFRCRASSLGAILVVLAFARPEGTWDGHKLHAVCSRGSEHKPGGECVVYIRGVIDRFHAFIAAHCPHQTVSFGEIVGEVVRYLEDHPSERDQAASDLVLRSLKQHHGCAF